MQSRAVKIIWKADFYSVLGRRYLNKFSDPFEWLQSVILIGVFVFDFDFSDNKILTFTLLPIAWSSAIVFGYIAKHTGVLDQELYIQAEKNPVESEILEAARIIKRNENALEKINKNTEKKP